MTDYSFILRKMSADGQGYFSEEDRLRLLNAADRIAELEAALKPFADKADHHTQGAYWMDAIFTVDECRAAAAALKETGNERDC